MRLSTATRHNKLGVITSAICFGLFLLGSLPGSAQAASIDCNNGWDGIGVALDSTCVGEGGACQAGVGTWTPDGPFWSGECVSLEAWGCTGASVWESDGPNSNQVCVGNDPHDGCSPGIDYQAWSYWQETDSSCVGLP